MSSILGNRKRKDTKLTYKQLWEIEQNNRKMYEKQYKDLHERYVELQKGTELPELRLKIRQLAAELDDMSMLRIQETIAKNVLLYRQKEIKEYVNKLENKVVEKEYIEKVLNGELDDQLKEKWEEKEDGE